MSSLLTGEDKRSTISTLTAVTNSLLTTNTHRKQFLQWKLHYLHEETIVFGTLFVFMVYYHFCSLCFVIFSPQEHPGLSGKQELLAGVVSPSQSPSRVDEHDGKQGEKRGGV